MYAAGMTIKGENYPLFKEAFEKIVRETIHPDLLVPEILIDAEIEFSDIDQKLIRLLKQFEPYGPQNMTPVFLSRNVNDTGYGKTIGEDDCHLKLYVKQNAGEGFPAIGFGLGKKHDITKDHQRFDVAYCIDENEYNGNVSLQLRIKDIREIAIPG